MKLTIVTPVYNDWESAFTLIRNIDQTLADRDIDVSVVMIDDGSAIEIPERTAPFANLSCINEIEVVKLQCNLGHQRAIAVGLSDIMARRDFDAVVVMDCDGEDSPDDIPAMLDEYSKDDSKIIVARRDKRSEGLMFRTGYLIYRLIFRILIAENIHFGNFSLIPRALLSKLVHNENLWNHLAATILRSNLPVKMIPTRRGNRYAGESKMNLRSLVLLGLSAMAVYRDVALIRTLFMALLLIFVTLLGLLAVIGLKFFMPATIIIPGWASDVFGSLVVILLQGLLATALVLFITLGNRAQKMFLPARDYPDYLDDRITLLAK